MITMRLAIRTVVASTLLISAGIVAEVSSAARAQSNAPPDPKPTTTGGLNSSGECGNWVLLTSPPKNTCTGRDFAKGSRWVVGSYRVPIPGTT